jgi:hypothetical protein
MANSFAFSNPDEEDPLFEFFLGQGFIQETGACSEFLAGSFEYQEEAFNMQQLLRSDDLEGGIALNPTYPSVVSLDLEKPIRQMQMYTQCLDVLAAPPELCVQKALELISFRATYELNIETFRMELFQDEINTPGAVEVNALIKGIRCIADYLLANFDIFTQSNADAFPYEFYQLHMGKYLFLSKIVIDASIPKFRPATVSFPAYSYPGMQAPVRADYITQADQCLVI